MRVLLLFVLSLASVSCSKPKRLQALEEMVLVNRILHLDAEDYTRFVHKGPRPYHVIVLVAPYLDPRYSRILTVVGSLSSIANSYESYLTGQRNRVNAVAPREIVFVLVDGAKHTEILSSHGAEAEVVLFHLSPVDEKSTDPIPLSSGMMFSFRGVHDLTRNIHQWVTSETNVDFVLEVSFLEAYFGYFVLTFFVGIMLWVLKMILPVLISPYQPMFWCGVCCVVWFFVTSGMHYCILREVPLWGVHPRRQTVMLFHPSPSSQFALEGFFMSGCMLVAAMLLIFMVDIYPTLEHPDKKTLGFMMGVICFGSFLFVRNLFAMKQHWN